MFPRYELHPAKIPQSGMPHPLRISVLVAVKVTEGILNELRWREGWIFGAILPEVFAW
jgi:hypothetical protein